MKKIAAFMAMAAAALLTTHGAFALGVSVNGNKVNFSVSDGRPFIENGRTLVPLRAAAEAYGAEVSFDSAANTAVISKDNIIVRVPIGEKIIYRNGEPIVNDVEAKIVDSRTYLPIRVVMEAYDAEVGWNEGSQTVTVNDPDVMYIKQVEGASGFSRKNATNKALDLQKQAKAKAKAGDCHHAALLFDRAAYYWDKAPGQEQTALHCRYMAEYTDSYVNLYLKTSDERYNTSTYFGETGEPKNGILLGTTYKSEDTSSLTGIEHGAELQYFDYGTNFAAGSAGSWYFAPAAKSGKVLEIGWQPNEGLDMVVENDYLINQAKFLESTGCKILLRFANEMNDTSAPWYTADYNKYIEKFRLVAKVFREYAPSVAMVWAPNFYPYDTVDLYYPGDEYVDYVGLSIYQEYDPENDPLEEGVERGRWSNILDKVYNTYGWKKPIIMSEGGCSTISVWTKKDVTDFAAKQMVDYYTYLPIKYPNLKIAVLFNTQDWGGREFRLAQNPTMLDAYIQGAGSSGRYVGNSDNEAAPEYYRQLQQNFTVPSGVVELCSYLNYLGAPISELDYVVYTINGVETTAYAIPYTVSVDLSPYSGQTVEVKVQGFGGGISRASKTFKLHVD